MLFRFKSLLPLILLPTLIVPFSFSLSSCNKEEASMFIDSNTPTETLGLYMYGTDVKFKELVDQENVINLQTISKANKGVRKFIIKGDLINKPIFIPLGSNFELSAEKDSKMLINGNSGQALGIMVGTNKANDTTQYTTNVKIHNISVTIADNGGTGESAIFLDHATNVEIHASQISTTQGDVNSTIYASNVKNLNIHDNIITNNGVGSQNVIVEECEKLSIKHNLIENFCNQETAFAFKGNIAEGEIFNNFISSETNTATSVIVALNGSSNLMIKNNIFHTKNATAGGSPTCTFFSANGEGVNTFTGTNLNNVFLSNVDQKNEDLLKVNPNLGTYVKTSKNMIYKHYGYPSTSPAYHYDFFYYEDTNNSKTCQAFNDIVNGLKNDIKNEYTIAIVNGMAEVS
ncbi:MAG: hypothetical protein LBB39_02330 [Mycoplasmataceae bacterium]|jgi:hypothetical protein|nr:hypothetical protein [Mycoplasmataceae bacterium]